MRKVHILTINIPTLHYLTSDTNTCCSLTHHAASCTSWWPGCTRCVPQARGLVERSGRRQEDWAPSTETQDGLLATAWWCCTGKAEEKEHLGSQPFRVENLVYLQFFSCTKQNYERKHVNLPINRNVPSSTLKVFTDR